MHRLKLLASAAAASIQAFYEFALLIPARSTHLPNEGGFTESCLLDFKSEVIETPVIAQILHPNINFGRKRARNSISALDGEVSERGDEA